MSAFVAKMAFGGRLAIDPITTTFPVHDAPVAWRASDYAGFPVIACPAMHPRHWALVSGLSPSYLDPEPIVLDGEPGRGCSA